MKRTVIAAASAGIAVVLVAGLIQFTFMARPAGRLDAPKLLNAVQTYAGELRAQDLPVPTTVSLRELIDKRLLAETDVSAFAGMDVTLSLEADERRPEQMLLKVRMEDGHEIVALADGSVQPR